MVKSLFADRKHSLKGDKMNWINDNVAVGDIGDVENNPTYIQNLRAETLNVSNCFKKNEDGSWGIIPDNVDVAVEHIINNFEIDKNTMVYATEPKGGAQLICAAYLSRSQRIDLENACEIMLIHSPFDPVEKSWIDELNEELIIDEDDEIPSLPDDK